MSDALIAGIGVSAAGGLTWLAWNHPTGYRQLARYLLVAIFAFMIGRVALTAAYAKGAQDEMKNLVESNKGIKVPPAIPLDGTWLIWLSGLMIYTILLEMAPRFKDATENGRPQSPSSSAPSGNAGVR